MRERTSIKNLGELVKVVKNLNQDEITELLIHVLSSNSYTIRKNKILNMQKLLNDNGFLMTDDLLYNFIGYEADAAVA